MKKKIAKKISKYRFEFRHILVLLAILISFQIILSFIQKSSLKNFLDNTQTWYQQDSAERMANLSTTSLELLVGNMSSVQNRSGEEKQRIIQSFNIIFSQQLVKTNIFSMIALNKTQKIDEGYLSVRKENKQMLGKIGTTYTVLRPGGKVEIDGEIFDAKAVVGFIDKNKQVEVVKYEMAQLYVAEIS